jgi:hypothetical protein
MSCVSGKSPRSPRWPAQDSTPRIKPSLRVRQHLTGWERRTTPGTAGTPWARCPRCVRSRQTGRLRGPGTAGVRVARRARCAPPGAAAVQRETLIPHNPPQTLNLGLDGVYVNDHNQPGCECERSHCNPVVSGHIEVRLGRHTDRRPAFQRRDRSCCSTGQWRRWPPWQSRPRWPPSYRMRPPRPPAEPSPSTSLPPPVRCSAAPVARSTDCLRTVSPDRTC